VAAVPSPGRDAAAAAADLDDEDDEDDTPRVKPAIPGMDLEVDIVARARTRCAATYARTAEADGDAGDGRGGPPAADRRRAIDLAAGARYRATGKRKTAVARVILKPGTGAYAINGSTLDEFFPRPRCSAHPPAAGDRRLRGPHGRRRRDARRRRLRPGRRPAPRHLARAARGRPQPRGELKRRGFLTRDARVKERKKAGLKKARKRPQFSKR
jgi:small subunit ribosomal protein S9